MSQKILTHLQNPIWKLYFHFLDFVLPKFTELNFMFQSAKMSIHCLHNSLQAIYRDFLSCYMREAYWRHTPLQEVDPNSNVNFLHLISDLLANLHALQVPRMRINHTTRLS